jgi:molecular chaperone DnaK
MVKDAEANAEADKKKKELVEAKNHAEALIHTTEKTLKENSDKISSADKSAIETAVADLKTVIDGEDVEAIKSKSDNLKRHLIGWNNK